MLETIKDGLVNFGVEMVLLIGSSANNGENVGESSCGLTMTARLLLSTVEQFKFLKPGAIARLRISVPIVLGFTAH
jgi:hypothetical protein